MAVTSVRTGEEIRLECEPRSGLPTWERNGVLYRAGESMARFHIDNRGSLIIQSAIDEDKGKYICITESKHRYETSLTVLGKKIKFFSKSSLLPRNFRFNGRKSGYIEIFICENIFSPESRFIGRIENKNAVILGVDFVIFNNKRLRCLSRICRSSRKREHPAEMSVQACYRMVAQWKTSRKSDF